MRISERCSCGASVEVEHQSSSVAEKYVSDWRVNHKHEHRYPHGMYATNYAGEMVDVPVWESSTGVSATELRMYTDFPETPPEKEWGTG